MSTNDEQVEMCGNCDGRHCMACVFREVHDACEWSCPVCEPLPAHAAGVGDLTAEVERLRERSEWWERTATGWHDMCQEAWRQRDFNATAVKSADHALADLRGRVEALVAPQWRPIPSDLPDDPMGAYSQGRNDTIDALRAALAGDTTEAGAEGRGRCICDRMGRGAAFHLPRCEESWGSPAPDAREDRDALDDVLHSLGIDGDQPSGVGGTVAETITRAVLAALHPEPAPVSAEQAWDEGWAAGCNDQHYGDDLAEPWTPNPYAVTPTDGGAR